MPAFGLSAVPSPIKIRRMLPGSHAPTAAADGDATADPTNAVDGSPVLTAAAGAAVRAAPPNSRRVYANAVHANGPAPGPSPPPPAPNHANTEPPSPMTRPDAAETPLETTEKKIRFDEHCEGAGWRDFARPEARVGATQGGAGTRTFELTEFLKPQRSRTARAGQADRHNGTVLENVFRFSWITKKAISQPPTSL